MGDELLQHRVAAVEIPAGQQSVESATEAIDIDASIHQLRLEGLLGRHVIDRAHYLT
nr:hypothetical protein [Anatilimnocola floriformis]